MEKRGKIGNQEVSLPGKQDDLPVSPNRSSMIGSRQSLPNPLSYPISPGSPPTSPKSGSIMIPTNPEKGDSKSSPTEQPLSPKTGRVGWTQSRVPAERVPSLDSKLGSRSGSEKKQHHFITKIFTTPLFCKYCKGFIWGVGKSGYICTECDFCIHRECLASSEIETSCITEKNEKGEEELLLDSQLKTASFSMRTSGTFSPIKTVGEPGTSIDQMELQVKLENLFLEKHRIVMKYQLANFELNKFLHEKPQMEEEMRKLSAAQKDLIENIAKALTQAADRDNDIQDTVQLTNRIKGIMSESSQSHEILSKKVEELKFVYNAINPTTGTPQKLETKTVQQVNGVVDSLQTVMQQLEGSAVQCRELIFHNTKLLMTRAEELKRHNENLEQQLQQLQHLNDQVSRARAELRALSTSLDTTKSQFKSLKENLQTLDIVDPNEHRLTTKFEAIVQELVKCHVLLESKVDVFKRTQSSIHLKAPPLEGKEPIELQSEETLEAESSNSLYQRSAPSTIERLIERLTFHSNLDVDFQKNFLLTYKTFMTTSDLFEKLILRYCITPPPNQTRVGSIKQNFQIPIRLRVLNVIKSLIDHNSADFYSNPDLKKSFFEFMDVVESTGLHKLASQLRSLLEKKSHGENKEKTADKLFDKAPPESIVPSDPWYTLMDVEPIELARQLTLLAFEKYKNIQPEEFLNLAWSKKDKETNSPNLLELIRTYNRTSNWVTTEVLKGQTIQKRAEAITKFLQVAQECKKLFNFNGVFEILGGLGHAAVYRLRQSWALVSKEMLAFYDQISQLTKNNYKLFRDEMQNAGSPCIPYLGVYLTDLTFLEEMGPNVTHEGLINFAKLQKVAETIRLIQQYQQGSYCLKIVQYIREDLREFKEMTDKEAWNLSLKAEPRQPASDQSKK